jgi:hypothetical protein
MVSLLPLLLHKVIDEAGRKVGSLRAFGNR